VDEAQADEEVEGLDEVHRALHAAGGTGLLHLQRV
jgi:hypothetical protein